MSLAKYRSVRKCVLFASLLSSCAAPIALPSIVSSPRVLAIIANNSVVAPGATFTLTPIVGGTSTGGIVGTMTWSFCARPEQASAGIPLSSFGTFESEQGCFTNNALILTQDIVGPRATFTVSPNVLQNDSVLRIAFGNQVSDTTRTTLAQTAGIALVVHLHWVVDATTTVDAFKRILVLPNGDNFNPPPPVVRVNDRVIQADPLRSSEECVIQGIPLVVAPRTKLTFAPDPDESWAESFTVIDSSGQAVTQQEQSFRSWFSTAGVWDLGRARMPDLAPSWTAPSTAGPVTFWLIVRDGHGGASACRWAFDVQP